MNVEQILANQNEKIHHLESQLLYYQSELNTYQKRCEQYLQAYDALQHQLKELLRHRFGKKSERFIDDPEHPQQSLLDDKATFSTADALGQAVDNEIQATRPARKKKSPSEKELPVRIEIIPVCDADKQCACGACKTVIRYEIKRLMHYQQATYEIIEQRREVVACQQGCDGEILTAPAPLQVLPKTKATEEFLSLFSRE